MSDDQRTAIIREICQAEGHGRVVDTAHPMTLFLNRRQRHVHCERGCGAVIVDLLVPHTVAEIQDVLDRLGADSSAVLDRGRITIWPEPTPAVVPAGQHETEEQ